MTTAVSRMARAFGLEGSSWLRHANPWSVYTRVPVPAALAVAVWSRDWIGWWSLVPVALVCTWAAVNPTAFRAPRSLDHWASKAVLGERFWGARSTTPIPPHHRTAAMVLSVVSALGLPPLVWGLVVLDGWMVAAGLVLQTLGKVWLLDRMVWLYEDMTRAPAADGARPIDRPI